MVARAIAAPPARWPWRPRRWLGGAFLTLLAALPVGAPMFYLGTLAWQSIDAGLPVGDLPGLILGVLALATGTTIWAVAIGVPMAWLAARADVPGRRLLAWLAPLPLTVPPYVAALAYALLLSRGGSFHTLVADLVGVPSTQLPFPGLIHSPFGAAFVLGLFTYPYVYLPVFAALERGSPALEEAARSLGSDGQDAFRRVTLPLLRPAVAAGALLVFMYAMVDFGVVSILRVRTITTAIYTDLLAGFSLPAAARLSMLLVLMIWALLLLQRRALGTASYVQVTGRSRPPRPIPLGRLRWPALVWSVSILALALLVPILTLVWQLGRFRSLAEALAFVGRQAPYVVNTLTVALGGATLCVLLGVGVAWLGPRLPGGTLSAGALQAGYAIPGTVLGLALVGFYLNWLPPAYGTPLGVALAYVVLFGAHGYQAARAALAQISPTLEEAARGMGLSPPRALLEVVIPVAWPGLLGGWLLVAVLALRELAATLILRPPGFDTLSVRVWVHVSDVGPDPRAAAVALLLVVAIAVLWLAALMLRRRAVHLPL